MEIVGGVGGDVGGQPCHEVPGLLGTVAHEGGSAQLVARKETSDISLRSG